MATGGGKGNDFLVSLVTVHNSISNIFKSLRLLLYRRIPPSCLFQPSSFWVSRRATAKSLLFAAIFASLAEVLFDVSTVLFDTPPNRVSL